MFQYIFRYYMNGLCFHYFRWQFIRSATCKKWGEKITVISDVAGIKIAEGRRGIFRSIIGLHYDVTCKIITFLWFNIKFINNNQSYRVRSKWGYRELFFFRQKFSGKNNETIIFLVETLNIEIAHLFGCWCVPPPRQGTLISRENKQNTDFARLREGGRCILFELCLNTIFKRATSTNHVVFQESHKR